VFNFGEQLAWVKIRNCDGTMIPSVQAMSNDAIRNRLAEVALFQETRPTKGGSVTIHTIFPPRDIVRAIVAQKSWSDRVAPPLDLLAESPRFLPDGSLILTPGYHPEGRLYYHPPGGLIGIEVPERPTPEEVDWAQSLLLDQYLRDFPFADSASKANALACMLLPFVRPCINGATPLHLFEASTEGTGKGKLANACAYPSLLRQLPSTSQKEDESEWRKSITSALKGGPSHVYFDNLYNPKLWDGSPQPIDSANLAAALTQPIWKDRELGVSRDVVIHIRCVWMGSGNNIELSKELDRRTTSIRLKTPIENPSERTGFWCETQGGHPTLEAWAAAHQKDLLRACLILCRHWFVEDKPAGKYTMGSYEEYARVMGGILDCAGIPDFLGNRTKKAGKDRESLRWGALVEAWHAAREKLVTSTADLHTIISGNEDLTSAFAEIMEGSLLGQKQKLGKALQKQEDRIWGKWRIVRSAAKGHGGTIIYRLADPAETEPETESSE
jgi:hypothetical protein